MRIQNTQDKQSFSAGKVTITKRFKKKSPLNAAIFEGLEGQIRRIAQEREVDLTFNQVKKATARLTVSTNKSLPGDPLWKKFINMLKSKKNDYNISAHPSLSVSENEIVLLAQIDNKALGLKNY